MAEAGREKFLKRRHMIFAAIGSAIGLGNVWRFPYMCYQYGELPFGGLHHRHFCHWDSVASH